MRYAQEQIRQAQQQQRLMHEQAHQLQGGLNVANLLGSLGLNSNIGIRVQPQGNSGINITLNGQQINSLGPQSMHQQQVYYQGDESDELN